MRNVRARSLETWWHLRLSRQRNDGGLTLVELVVTLLVIAIVMTLTSMLIVSVNQQSSDMLDTLKGVESATGAEQSFIQYLQGSTELLALFNGAGTQIAPSDTEMDMVVNDGFSTTTPGSNNPNNWGNNEPYTSNCTNLDAIWSVPSSPAGADAQFSVGSDVQATGLPNQAPWSTAGNGAGPYTFNPTSPCSPPSTAAIRSVSNYYALSTQTDPVFTYWAWGTVSTSTTTTIVAKPNIPPGLVQLPVNAAGVIPLCALSEVAAVGIHVTFLAGPQTPKEGFAADQPTTLSTLVFLIGNATAGATTSTTTTSTTSACPE
ncbi:MAG: prepilin-type N-terminal cleavage/methylation domain-containing protein [Acidimicrobiales bacterium]|jgi:prepilin-type N-terminal cleavage/methylation domain-containing protein